MSEVPAYVEQRAYPVFVYGTLRPRGGRYDVVERFVDEYGVVDATVDGFQIYKFDAFPGAVRTEGAVGLQGNILVLKGVTYIEAMERLDRYEAVGFLFNRVLVDARTERGDVVPCWFYEARSDALLVSRGEPIEDNNWLGWR